MKNSDRRSGLLITSSTLALLTSAAQAQLPTGAIGQDFTQVPANSDVSAINSVLRPSSYTNSVAGYSGQIYFDGTFLWIDSAANQAANKSSQYPSGIWPSTGFETSNAGCASSFGYGTFHYKGKVGYSHNQLTQGPGVNYILWNADNSWIAAKNGSAVSEFDLLESNYNNLGQGVATIHYYDTGASGNNGSIANTNINYGAQDFTYVHNYDVVWTNASMIEYVDGVVVLSVPSQHLPKDYADGGCNKSLGVQMAMQAQGFDKLPTAQILTQEMWWSPSQSPPNYGPTPPTSPQPNKLTISVPTQVTAGKAFSVTGTDNYSLTSVALSIDGKVVSTQTPVISGQSFTITGPASLSAGSHTAQVQGQDSTSSNTVTFTAAAATAPPSGLSITSTMLKGSTLGITVSKSTGGPNTVRFSIDGHYLGVLEDHAPDGTLYFDPTLSPLPAAGSHTEVVYLDGSSLYASATFSVPVMPTPPVSNSQLKVGRATLSGNVLKMRVIKATGANATLRFRIDGKYVGTLQDNAPDGTLSDSASLSSIPTSGPHTLTVYVDSTNISSTVSFTAP